MRVTRYFVSCMAVAFRIWDRPYLSVGGRGGVWATRYGKQTPTVAAVILDWLPLGRAALPVCDYRLAVAFLAAGFGAVSGAGVGTLTSDWT